MWDACSIRNRDTDKCSCVTAWLFFLTQQPCTSLSFHSNKNVSEMRKKQPDTTKHWFHTAHVSSLTSVAVRPHCFVGTLDLKASLLWMNIFQSISITLQLIFSVYFLLGNLFFMLAAGAVSWCCDSKVFHFLICQPVWEPKTRQYR